MAGAKVKNPRKKFLWQIIFVKHPINPFLFQKVTVPEISIEQVAHGDVNYDVKTGGRVSVGNLTASKLETTSGSDTWLWGLADVSTGYAARGRFNPKSVQGNRTY